MLSWCLLATLSASCKTSSDDAGGSSPSSVSASGDGGSVASGSVASADGSGASSGAGGSGASAADGSGASGDRPRNLDYLLADRYERLALEIDVVPGFEPRAQAESRLVQRLDDLLGKPGGIRTVYDEQLEFRGDGYEWSLEALQTLAAETFDPASSDGEIRIHVMFVNGRYVAPDVTGTVLGLAWGHTHVAMFEEAIEGSCADAGLGLVGPLMEQACSEAEYGVWLHEIGHIIGLVDNGLDMVESHDDPDHPPHDASEECIMYWAYDGSALVDLIANTLLGGGEPKLDFDAACLADIAAAQAQP